jgi:hypothetical protein
MVRPIQSARCRLLVPAILALGSGCTMVPRSEVAECQRISQTLRAENARYKDQNLALQAQNRRATRESSAGSRSLKGSASNDESRIR